MGLIPAAGQARRLGLLPCSKEILPVLVRQTAAGPVPRALCRHLLGCLGRAGVGRAFVVTTAAKWDIPRHLTTGEEVRPEEALPGEAQPGEAATPALAYLCLSGSASVPETLDRAYPFVAGSTVALGFPDVLFQPEDAFQPLLRRRWETGADLVLGLFPAPDPRRTDMVEVDPEGRVRAIQVRPPASDLTYNWLLAVWSPRFTDFLHQEVAASRGGGGDGLQREELQLGEIFRRALAAGLPLRGVPFPRGSYLDVGTPKDLQRALSGRAHREKSQ